MGVRIDRHREPPRAQVIAVFASRADWRRVAPRSEPLGSARGLVRVTNGFVARGALLGAVAVALLGLFAAGLIRGSGLAPVPGFEILLATVTGGLAGAFGGALLVRRAPRAVERDLDRHRARGLVAAVVGASPDVASFVARELEERGALEATVLPAGVRVAVGNDADWQPPPILHDDAFGGTLVAGEPLIASAVRHLGGEAVRFAVVGRTGRGAPVHSSTGGPVQIPAPWVPTWWRPFAESAANTRRLPFSDGELLIAGEAAPFVLETLEGHENDTISSALARLAERLGCPDGSARIVLDTVDSGGVGVVILGTKEARRRAVELLSFTATASSEGRVVLDRRDAERRVA